MLRTMRLFTQAVAFTVIMASTCWAFLSPLLPQATLQHQWYTSLITSSSCIGNKRKSLLLLHMADNNSRDDDWYSDYNPNEFTRYSNSRSEGGRRTTNYGQDQQQFSSSRGGREDNRRLGGGGSRRRYSDVYERDTSMDNSNVDLDTVSALISDRLMARKNGDYDTADTIRATLLQEHGVQLWDKEKIWRSGCSASGSGARFRGRDPSQRAQQRGGPYSDRQRGMKRRVAPEPMDFGPNGHDYEQAPDAGLVKSSLTENEIHQLISERLQSKLMRNFDRADQIQAELASSGVYVHDGKKQWRADGEWFGAEINSNGRPGKERGRSFSSQKFEYTQSVHSQNTDLSDDTVNEIENLICLRSKAKSSRDYNTADKIREQLKEEFNVFIEDRLMQWSVNGMFGNKPGIDDMPWKQSEFSLQDVVDEKVILRMLEERSEAKAARDFDTADNIRDTLVSEYNIAINDRLRQWSIGGDFGFGSTPARSKNSNSIDRFNKPFIQRGGFDLSNDEAAIISAMVEERAQAKKNRDFATADALRDQLEEKYSVKVDDKAREWRVITDEYNLSPFSHKNGSLDDETLTYIRRQLKQRSEFKASRDFEAADEIRDRLREEYSVSIDDRSREFAIIVDEFSLVPKDDSNSVFQRRPESAETQPSPSDMDMVKEKPELLENLTVVDLKIRLKELGLPVSGRKDELIQRLTSET